MTFQAVAPFEGSEYEEFRSYSNSSQTRESFEAQKTQERSIILSNQTLLESEERLKKKKACCKSN